MSSKMFSPPLSGVELAWETEFDRRFALKKPRAKPVSVRHLQDATAWLDGELCWREGRVWYRHNSKMRSFDAAAMRRTGRALHVLAHKGGVSELIARRQAVWEWASALFAVEAPDLVALCAQSRRSNPAAVARLKWLLAIEALSSTPLEASPARALVKAWPLSRDVLLELCDDSRFPAHVGALAALCLNAAAEIDAVPSRWRGVAARATVLDWVSDARLEPALVAAGALESDSGLWHYLTLVEGVGPFPFDNGVFREQSRTKGFAAALKVADAVAGVPHFWPRLPEIAPLCDVVVLNQFPEKYSEHRIKAAESLWRGTRRTMLAETASLWWYLACRDASALPFAARCLKILLHLPLHAIESAAPARVKGRKKKLARSVLPHEKLSLSSKALDEWWRSAVHLVREIAKSETPRAMLELMSDVLAPFALEVPVLRHHTACGALFIDEWMPQVRQQVEGVSLPILHLSRRLGPDVAREAWTLGALNTLDQECPSRPWAQAALHLFQCIGPSRRVVGRLFRWHRAFEDAGHAQRWIDEIVRRTPDWSGEDRHHLFDTILAHPFKSAKIARASLSQFPQYLDLLVEARCDWPESVRELGELVIGLVEEVPEGRVPLENLRPFVGHVLQFARTRREGPYVTNNLGYLACLAGSVCDTSEQFEALLSRFWTLLERNWNEWEAAWNGVKGTYSHRALMEAVRLAVKMAPDRTFTALERLGTLVRAAALEGLDMTALCQELTPVTNEASWQEVLKLDVDLAGPAQEWRRWARAAGMPDAPPKSVIKVLEWPRAWQREIEALRQKIGNMDETAEESRRRCEKRLQNLEARLVDNDGNRVTMSAEIRETLSNSTQGAALQALERVIARALAARLQNLCGAAAREVELDADLLNALLLACELEANRKWARQILRQHFEGNLLWREALPANARFLSGIRERGVDVPVFLSRFERQRGEWAFWIEDEPLGVLQMGNRFNTCLSRGGCNEHSSIANAIDLNKRVVYARDRNGHIIGRQLWGLSTQNNLVGFTVYSTLPGTTCEPLERAFTAYAREFALACGVELADEGEVENLVVFCWYDDGLTPWEPKAQEVCQTVAST